MKEKRSLSPVVLLFGGSATRSSLLAICAVTAGQSGKAPIKWRSSARLSGGAISMRLPEVAMPRTSTHAASGDAAPNDSFWEVAA